MTARHDKATEGRYTMDEGAIIPTDAPAHEFVGRRDRWCEVCNLPDRHPVHVTATAGRTEAAAVDQAIADAERLIARVATGGTIVCSLCNASDVTDDDHRAGCPVHDLRAALRVLADAVEKQRIESERSHRHVETMIEPQLLARAKAAEAERTRYRIEADWSHDDYEDAEAIIIQIAERRPNKTFDPWAVELCQAFLDRPTKTRAVGEGLRAERDRLQVECASLVARIATVGAERERLAARVAELEAQVKE